MELLFEVVMHYPIEVVRKSYFEEKKKKESANFDILSLLSAGYDADEIIEMKGLNGSTNRDQT